MRALFSFWCFVKFAAMPHARTGMPKDLHVGFAGQSACDLHVCSVNIGGLCLLVHSFCSLAAFEG